MITDVEGIGLAVFSADCIPVLLYDAVRKIVGAVHAGWRGTALGIAEKAVCAMRENFGCDPGNITAAIGPGISSCCFETSDDVPDAMYAALGNEAEPYLKQDGLKWHVDLKGLNACFLRRAGLPEAQIDISNYCTACRPDLFWSHRKLGEARGSQAAVIALV
jgi:YfiH family protein